MYNVKVRELNGYLSFISLTPLREVTRSPAVFSQHCSTISHRKTLYSPSRWAPVWLSWAVKHMAFKSHTKTSSFSLCTSDLCSTFNWTLRTQELLKYTKWHEVNNGQMSTSSLTLSLLSFFCSFLLFWTPQGTTGRAEDVSGKWDMGTVPGQV